MYDKSQLDSKRKDFVIAIALELQDSLNAIKNAPATPNAVKAEVINLKREIGFSKERVTELANEYKIAKLKIEKDAEKTLKELSLKYETTSTSDQEKIIKEYKSIVEKVAKAKEELTFGLEKETLEIEAKMAGIKDSLAKAKESYDDSVNKLKEDLKEFKENNVEQYKGMQTAHERKVEELVYNNNRAIRDKDTEYLDAICKLLNFSYLPKEELDELKAFKASDEKSVQDAIDQAVTEAKASVHQSEGAKYSSLKSKSEMEEKIANVNISNLTSNLNNANTRIVELEARLKDVPNQIAKAVEAAKSSVTVSQDAGKK